MALSINVDITKMMIYSKKKFLKHHELKIYGSSIKQSLHIHILNFCLIIMVNSHVPEKKITEQALERNCMRCIDIYEIHVGLYWIEKYEIHVGLY